MTACRNKASRAVTAALVGVLSVGAVPVVALATGVNDGASLQAVADNHDSFMAGTVAAYTIDGEEVEGNEAVTVKRSELADSEIVITKVTPSGVDLDPVDVPTGVPTFYYKKATGTTAGAFKINGEWYVGAGYGTSGFQSLTAGEYIAVAKYDVAADNFTAGNSYIAPELHFTVVSDSLEGAKLMKPLGNGEYTDQLTYEYSKTWDELEVVLAGKPCTDATAKVYASGQAGGDLVAAQSGILPGTYEVVIEGNAGTDYAGEKVEYTIEVTKLDLSTLNLYLDDVIDGANAPTIASIQGSDKAKLGSYLSGTYMDFQIDKTWGTSGVGEYTYTLSVKADTDAADRVEGTLTLSFNRVNAGAKVASWYYDGKHHFSDGGQIVVDRSFAKDDYNSSTWTLKDFDLSNFTGVYKNADGEDETFGSESYEVTIRDAEGNIVSSMDKKGVYDVTLEAKSADFGWNVQRSTITFKVTYKQGTIGTAGTTFSYDGKVVTSTIPVTYDGQDYLDRIGIQVKDTNGNVLTEGTDYTVTVTDKATNEVVDGIVDKGEYTVTVSSDTYEFDNSVSATNSIDVEVSAFALTAANTRVTFPTAITYNDPVYVSGNYKDNYVTFIPYTGDDIVPVVEVALTKDSEGNDVWTALDSSLYVLSYKTGTPGATWTPGSDWLDAMKDKGNYRVTVKIDAEATENFTGQLDDSNDNKGFEVADTKVFVDVDNTAYYAQAIYTAVNQGYVEGMNGSNLFAPDRSISRADMVTVLYRMAGGKVGDEDLTNSELSYVTKFADADANAYYAKALAWATKAGVVTGYEDGTFGPADDVTVEQFVTMLARYADAVGNYEAVEDVDAALSEVADGSQVSDFAQEAMAWAVENDFVGQGGADLQPQSSVSRGRAVTIAVRYQPAQADVIGK